MVNDEAVGAASNTISKKWVKDLVGIFLLDLYYRSVITSRDDFCVEQEILRDKFAEHLTKEQNEILKSLNLSADIEILMNGFGFLIKPHPTYRHFKINHEKLFKFRKEKLKELDVLQINCNVFIETTTVGKDVKYKVVTDNEDFSDEDQPKKPLEYQGSATQPRDINFLPNSICCFTCQMEFITMESFEDHVLSHNDESNFEFVKRLNKFDKPFFTISYSMSKTSHNFRFEIKSSLQNVIIDKIIIVRSNSFYYVNNTLVPYRLPANGIDHFYVDSHLFTKHLEQAIIILSHKKGTRDYLNIEEHHFMRSEEFPKLKITVNPTQLSNRHLFRVEFDLDQYFPSAKMQRALKDHFYCGRLMNISSEFRDYMRCGKKLQSKTIAQTLNTLLQIEDFDTIMAYYRITQTNVKLRQFGDQYSFQLNPAQKSFVESILSPYDDIILTPDGTYLDEERTNALMFRNTSDIQYRFKQSIFGIVQAAQSGRISFTATGKKIDTNLIYTVMFRPFRHVFRYQYRALELWTVNSRFLRKFLFPSNIPPMPLPSTSISLYNSNINEEQLQAVRNVFEGPRNDAPYVIFGPPGTGKTTTLIECVLQLLRKPDTKILIAAGSNAACDEVALRLCKFLSIIDLPRCLVRIFSRSSFARVETIPEELLENSNMYSGHFYPDVNMLHQYRVVVCTLSVVAHLATGKFGRHENGDGVYSHLFIDEVAASMETEALMAITAILTPKCSLIISGDHKQLGPVIKSDRAKDLGLDKSLMDRLLARDCYRVDADNGNYDQSIQTRLIKNYRSHPAIVDLYSALYYNYSLEPCAKIEKVSLSEVWYKLHKKSYPIMFHACYEGSKSDNISPSLYNSGELDIVMDYVKEFMYFGINGKPVQETDIGIISPYKKQYKIIQEALNMRKWFNIETGSVEKFQGKEKTIIIVSFVRSDCASLGFLTDPRRLNVTLSRPKCILILIGNPDTLSKNKDYDYVIKECKRNKTFFDNSATPNSNSQQTPIDVFDLKSVSNSGDTNRRQDQYRAISGGNYNNNGANIINNDAIFNNLPELPATPVTQPTCLTNEQSLKMQEQQQYYNNLLQLLQINQHLEQYQNNNYNYQNWYNNTPCNNYNYNGYQQPVYNGNQWQQQYNPSQMTANTNINYNTYANQYYEPYYSHLCNVMGTFNNANQMQANSNNYLCQQTTNNISFNPTNVIPNQLTNTTDSTENYMKVPNYNEWIFPREEVNIDTTAIAVPDIIKTGYSEDVPSVAPTNFDESTAILKEKPSDAATDNVNTIICDIEDEKIISSADANDKENKMICDIEDEKPISSAVANDKENKIICDIEDEKSNGLKAENNFSTSAATTEVINLSTTEKPSEFDVKEVNSTTNSHISGNEPIIPIRVKREINTSSSDNEKPSFTTDQEATNTMNSNITNDDSGASNKICTTSKSPSLTMSSLAATSASSSGEVQMKSSHKANRKDYKRVAAINLTAGRKDILSRCVATNPNQTIAGANYSTDSGLNGIFPRISACNINPNTTKASQAQTSNVKTNKNTTERGKCEIM